MEKEYKIKIVFTSSQCGLITIEKEYLKGKVEPSVIKSANMSMGISSFPTATLEISATSQYPNLLSLKSGDDVSIYYGEIGMDFIKTYYGIITSISLETLKESFELSINSVSPFYALEKRILSSRIFRSKSGLREIFNEIIELCNIKGQIKIDEDVNNDIGLSRFKNMPALSIINSICYELDLVYDFDKGDLMRISNRSSLIDKIHSSIPIVIDDDKILSMKFNK